ncbi:hypothetical protein KIW84_013216 [Lathyrus oleraceus]|uniref:Uncharacterized protein n=1 Tax=Pisum sativum TaxID=3888 RepID=A0A9D5BJP9_PEA|nr:hypothetical protein KIW84_013216 [Pisum sativum]
MSKQSSPKHINVPTETSGSSSPTTRANEPFQIINLSDLVLDVALLSMIHPSPQNKATPYVSKNVNTSGKSFVSEPIIPGEDKTIVEERSRSKGFEIRNCTLHTGGTEDQTEAERSVVDKELWNPDGDSSEKDEESVPEHDALERRSKKKVDEYVPEHAAHERRCKNIFDHVVNVDELTSDEESLTNIVTPSIDKRLQRRKGKAVVFEDSTSKEIKRKYDGIKSTPSRSSIGKPLFGPTRPWSKVITPTKKRKVVSSSDSEFEDLMEEEKKETEQGGDDNGGTDVEDSADGNDVETDEEKEVEEEGYATADSDSQEDI